MYTKMEALDYRHLPRAGGIEDQDKALMDAIATIHWQAEIIEAHIEYEKQEKGGGDTSEVVFG